MEGISIFKEALGIIMHATAVDLILFYLIFEF